MVALAQSTSGIPTIDKQVNECQKDPSYREKAIMGFPVICDRDAKAAAQTVQRANSIGPGER